MEKQYFLELLKILYFIFFLPQKIMKNLGFPTHFNFHLLRLLVVISH